MRQKKVVTSQVHSARNPFEEAAQSSNLSYGLYMMERHTIRQKRIEKEEKEIADSVEILEE